MASTVEEIITTLLTLTQPDDQPSLLGVTLTHYYDVYANTSKIGYFDLDAYRLPLEDDTRTIKQMEVLLEESKSTMAMVYSYRQCSNALPMIPENSIGDPGGIHREAFDILEAEVNKISDLYQWHIKACELIATDMGWYWKGNSGPSWTHMWQVIKILDSMILIDHLMNSKTSLAEDVTAYSRIFPRFSGGSSWVESRSLLAFLSTPWSILKNLKAKVMQTPNTLTIIVQLIGFCLENLDLRHSLIWQERMALLRALAVLLVLVTKNDKEAETVFRKELKLDKVIFYFKREPILFAYQDSYIIPARVLLDLSPFFRKLQLEKRVEMPLGKIVDANGVARLYNLAPNLPVFYRTHEEAVLRFTTAINKVWHVRMGLEMEEEKPAHLVNRFGKELRDSVLSALIDCIRFCSNVTERVVQHFAWKLSHPLTVDEAKSQGAKTRTTDHGPISSYERAIRYNMTLTERVALVKVIGLVRGVSSMVLKAKNFLHEVIWEAVHGEIQEFVDSSVIGLLKKSSKKNGVVSGVLYHLRAVSADIVKVPEPPSFSKKEKQWPKSASSSSIELEPTPINARAVPPSFAQLHCMQHLVHILIVGSASMSKSGLFSEKEFSSSDIRDLLSYFHRLLLFPSILDFQGTILQVANFSFLWLRELYLERENVIQFPLECSLPWLLVEALFESHSMHNVESLESILTPFTIYNDAFDSSLHCIRQHFVSQEIEAEVDLAFDQLMIRLSEAMFTYYKILAASNHLDVSFVDTVERSKQPQFRPRAAQFGKLFQQKNMQILGRSVNMCAILQQHFNKMFRSNLDFIFERMDSVDLCSFWETKQLLDVLSATHSLLSAHCKLDAFSAMMAEATCSLSLTSFSSRVAAYINREVSNDLIPNFTWNTATQRFVRTPQGRQRPVKRPVPSRGNDHFLYGNRELNKAFSCLAVIHSQFVGLPHVQCLLALCGPRSLPSVIQHCHKAISFQVKELLLSYVKKVAPLLPDRNHIPPFELGFQGCLQRYKEQFELLTYSPILEELAVVLKDIGMLLAFLSLLDLAMKHAGTSQLIQAAPWLGVVSGQDGQLQQLPALTESDEPSSDPAAPLSELCQQAAIAAAEINPVSKSSLLGLLQAAHVAGVVYWSGIHGESLLVQSVATLASALLEHETALSARPSQSDSDDENGMLEFHVVYSAVEFIMCSSLPGSPTSSNLDSGNDALTWGACAIITVLGQQKRFELYSSVHHLVRVIQYECIHNQEVEAFLHGAVKAKRLHSHVFSLVKAHLP